MGNRPLIADEEDSHPFRVTDIVRRERDVQ